MPLAPIDSNIQHVKPPIPAGEKTKEKLKAFEFVPREENAEQNGDVEKKDGNETSDTLEGEDVQQVERGEIVQAGAPEHSAIGQENDKDPAKVPQLPHANTFPSTPSVRIPLEDLIGSFEESVQRPVQPQASPEERIGWIPNSSSTLLTPNRRKRRRARSSSPSCPHTSSQRHEDFGLLPGSALQAGKTTPDADPAAVLWKQYAADKAHGGDSDGRLPIFDNLVFDASPRPLKTPAKSAGFRRWASTGNDWPTSRSKRRRTGSKSCIGLWHDAPIETTGLPSRVSAMVDRIQESLATQKLASSEVKPAVRVSAPSSSSPLPEFGAPPRPRQLAESPSVNKQRPHLPPPERPVYRGPVQGRGPLSTARPLQASILERDLVPREAAAAAPDNFRPPSLHLQSKAPLPAFKRPSITRTQSTEKTRIHPAQIARAPPAAPPKAAASEFDEFGEDFDLSVEDLDEIMTGQPPLSERPLHQIPAYAEPQPQPPHAAPATTSRQQAPASVAGAAAQQLIILNDNDFDDDDDDEFGCNDMDEATLMQVEFRATQAYRASHP